jgi:transcriptional regulator with XRE-family HTH domain
MLLGNKIRSLRDEQGILQRQLAAYLEIDTPMFSKIERGDRRAKKSQVLLLAKYFHVDEKEMLILWLADKVLDALDGENELGLEVIETVKCKFQDMQESSVMQICLNKIIK